METVCTTYDHVGPLVRRRKTGFRGKRYIQAQCNACLRGVGKKIPADAMCDAVWRAFDAFRRRAHTPLRKIGKNSRRRRYQAFIQSTAWKLLRHKRLALDNYECVTCGNPATDVDHIDYTRFGGQERMEDLLSRCRSCHELAGRERLLA